MAAEKTKPRGPIAAMYSSPGPCYQVGPSQHVVVFSSITYLTHFLRLLMSDIPTDNVLENIVRERLEH